MEKIKVLCTIAFYLPGYKSGGPVRTISALTHYLQEEVKFNIYTSDRDLLDKSPYSQIAVNKWNEVGHANVFYASPLKQSLKGFIQLAKETPHDILYLNSFFDFKFALIPLIARRLRLMPKVSTILAPRGEFSPGALEISKWKKMFYIFLAKRLGFYDNIIWHASSEYEAEDIKRIMGRNNINIHIASDLTEPVKTGNELNRLEEYGDTVRICFISRISPKKNLDYALNVLSRIESTIVFDIYGPIEDQVYWEQCKDLIKNMRSNVSINYLGAVEHSHVRKIFSKYHLFFFPTRGENYGHVIAESMLAGTPVLLSDTTPWRNLMISGVGWDLPLNQEKSFIEAIEGIGEKSPQEYIQWRARIHSYAVAKLEDPDVINDTRLLFSSYLGH